MWHRPMLCVEDAQFTVNPAAEMNNRLLLRGNLVIIIPIAVYYSRYERLR